MKNIKIISLFVALIFVFSGCDTEDYTGWSTQTPTSPTITVDVGTIPPVNNAAKSTHTISLTMSETQIVDVAIHVLVTDGDAVEDENFSLSANPLVIKAGRTSVNLDVTILDGEFFETNRTFTIQVGDERTANASITPTTATFDITNATEDDLAVGLAWDANQPVYGVDGKPIDGADLADLFLEITDATGTVIYPAPGDDPITSALMLGTLPDGVYYATVGINGAMDLGDQGDASIDVFLGAAQRGILAESFEYLNFLSISKANWCNQGARTLEITKAGTTWTIDEFVDPSPDFDNYGGTDGLPTYYEPGSTIYIAACGLDRLIGGIGETFVENAWGEPVVASTPVVIDLVTDGTIAIADQYLYTTIYAGTLYDYDIINVAGTWTRDADGILSLDFTYDTFNVSDGYPLAGAFQAWYGIGPGYFHAVVTAGAPNPAKKVGFEKVER